VRPVATIVNDDARVRFAFGTVAETAGIEAECYLGGDEFLTRYAPKAGCVLLDVFMPDRSGPDVLREMNDRGWRVPVLAVGVRGFDPLAEETLHLGAVGRINTPVSGEDLVDAIRKGFVIDAWRRRERALQGGQC
jgi:FixJ family two-component response regulator